MHEPPVIMDETLVVAFQNDPQGAAGRQAVTELLSRWQGRAYVWAYRFTGEREQALDLAQDGLMRVYEALPRYQPRGKFSAWVFTIVHNACRDFARRRVHTARVEDLDTDTLPSSAIGPEAWFEQRDDQQRLAAAMESALEPDERVALCLRAYEGMSIDHITRTMGLQGASGARGLLQTARRKLRIALASGERGGRNDA